LRGESRETGKRLDRIFRRADLSQRLPGAVQVYHRCARGPGYVELQVHAQGAAAVACLAVNASGPLFLAEVGQVTLVICGIGAFLFVFFLFVGIWASRYRKVGPDEVMIVSGRKYEMITPEGKKTFAGFRIVRGGTFVWPIYEQAQTLSLKLIPLTLDRLAITAQDGKRL